MRAAAVLLGVMACVAATSIALADDARPAALTIRERKAGTFELRWQTPLRGEMRLRAAPRLPRDAVNVGGSYERRVTGDALVETWRFALAGGLEGRTLAVDGLAIARRGAILSIDLASGARHRAVLSGARTTFDVPERVQAGRVHWFEAAPSWVAAGVRRGLGWIHLLFAAALVLAGSRRTWVFASGAFLLADLAGRFVPFDLPASLGAALLALTGALATRELLLDKRRRIIALGALAGLAHGLATGASDTVKETCAAALGLDAVHLALGLVVLLAVRGTVRVRRPAGAAIGVAAMALAIVSAVEAPVEAAPSERPNATLPMAMVGEAPKAAARTEVDGLEFDLDVSVFQVRVELQARVAALVDWLGLDVPADPIPVAMQDAFLQLVTDAARVRLTLRLDGAKVDPALSRRGFTRRDALGSYLRTDAVSEPAADAVIGIVWTASTAGIPKSARLDVANLPDDTPLLARVLDPEVSRDVLLNSEYPRIEWINELQSDPFPAIEAVTVRTEAFVLPIAGTALALLSLAGFLVLLRRRGDLATVVLRWGLTAALVVMPAGALALPALGSGRLELTPVEARAITGTLLDNLFRSFNERGETEIYERLALSLAGDELEKAYLANRAALAVEEVGMSVHVEVVELRSLDEVARGEDGGFTAEASWIVAGSVTHFGHRHLRQNLYRAVLAIRPTGGAWKIDKLDVRDLDRTR